jgi:pyruvate carboxylase subunit B
MITKETKAYVQGLYGRPPGPIDPEVQKLCIGDETPITTRPADSLEPELPLRRAELDHKGLRYSEEDLLSYALFPQVALEFFERRDRKERPLPEVASLAAVIAELLGAREEKEMEAAAAACAPGTAASGWAAAARRERVHARGGGWGY